MQAKPRIVLPELLDHLVPSDLAAQRSRRDLQRIHLAMGTLGTLLRTLARMRFARPPRRILELGAGDGTLLLRLARALAPGWPSVELTLLDRHDLISPQTRAGYASLGWQVSVLATDILSWARIPCLQHYDLCVTTLFLHHFAEPDLSAVLAAVAARADAFVACEPRRDLWARCGSRLVGILGANRVTRADAIASVAAGFVDLEITGSWPVSAAHWAVEESAAFPFTHRFTAQQLNPMLDGHGR